MTHPFTAFDAKLGKFWNQHWRQIVYTKITNVLQHFDSLALTCTRHAGDNDQVELIHRGPSLQDKFFNSSGYSVFIIGCRNIRNLFSYFGYGVGHSYAESGSFQHG